MSTQEERDILESLDELVQQQEFDYFLEGVQTGAAAPQRPLNVRWTERDADGNTLSKRPSVTRKQSTHG